MLGASLVVIEHDMPLLTSIADRMIALDQGSLLAEGTPDEVLHDPMVIASYLGETQTAIERSGPRASSEHRRGADRERTCPDNYSANHTRGGPCHSSRCRRRSQAHEALRPADRHRGRRGGRHRRAGGHRKSNKTTPPPRPPFVDVGIVDIVAGRRAVLQSGQEGGQGQLHQLGSRCNVATGTLKYPSFFAGECYAPFNGNNGGATARA
jgi:hypothetical protein